MKLLQFVNQYLNSMCTKFRPDWSTGSCSTVCFSKSRFKALLSKLWQKSEKGQSFGKQFSELSGPNSLKFEYHSDPYLNPMCIKFRFDWATRSYETDRFSKSRFKALLCLVKLWRKSEKGQSFGKRFSGLSVRNCLKFGHL